MNPVMMEFTGESEYFLREKRKKFPARSHYFNTQALAQGEDERSSSTTSFINPFSIDKEFKRAMMECGKYARF